MRAGDTLLVGDLQVRRLGFGAMRLTGPGTWGEPRDRSAAKQVIRRAVDLGVNLIDTADAYGPGTSEQLIAEALHPYPEDLVIATKGGRTRRGPYQWGADCRPASLRDACEASLARLRLERIDLYQLHTVDPNVPLEESVGTLAELQAAGKVRHIGVCNVSVEQLSRDRWRPSPQYKTGTASPIEPGRPLSGPASVISWRSFPGCRSLEARSPVDGASSDASPRRTVQDRPKLLLRGCCTGLRACSRFSERRRLPISRRMSARAIFS